MVQISEAARSKIGSPYASVKDMSIYATLWGLHFPRFGDDHVGCEWVEVLAQGVPGHIGTPSPGHGYEDGDPYADFLPPPILLAPDDQASVDTQNRPLMDT